MSDTNPPYSGENALVISVNRENSGAKKKWYSVKDWSAHKLSDKKVPAAIKKRFHVMEKEGTMGAVATGYKKKGGPEILLYLLNITAMAANPGEEGHAGEKLSHFTTSLANQTILFRGDPEGGANVQYYHLTQDHWRVHPHEPKDWKDESWKVVDRLITDSALAIDIVKDPVANTSITCYLLNLASFTDPQDR